MAAQATKSQLMGGQRIVTIPNPVDTSTFTPRDGVHQRARLDIPSDAFVIVTSGVGGTGIHNKGWRLLRQALIGVVRAEVHPHLLMIGQSEIPNDLPAGVRGVVTGHLTDSQAVADALSCGDVFVTTSNIESFGLAAAEASSCAIPVIAPAATGLLDVVADQESGWLYTPDDVKQLTATIIESYERPDEARARGVAGRASAEELWSPEVVGSSYRSLYEEVLAARPGSR
jgi:glycosyltransferase involved in cell wall biosynthesis